MDTNLIAIIVGTNLIAIIGVGAALAGLILRQGFRLDHRIDTLQNQMQEQISGLQGQMQKQISGLQGQITDLRGQINRLQEQVTDLRERMARLEGIITGRTASEEEALRAQAGS